MEHAVGRKSNVLIGLNTHYFAHSFIPVFLGGMIYVVWRPPPLIMFDWFNYIGIGHLVSYFRLLGAPVSVYLPTWFVYSLPSGLWLYSFTFALTYVWYNSNSPLRYFWILLAPVMALGSEVFQLLNILPGTFDLADVSIYALSSVAAIAVARLIIINTNKNR